MRPQYALRRVKRRPAFIVIVDYIEHEFARLNRLEQIIAECAREPAGERGVLIHFNSETTRAFLCGLDYHGAVACLALEQTDKFFQRVQGMAAYELIAIRARGRHPYCQRFVQGCSLQRIYPHNGFSATL